MLLGQIDKSRQRLIKAAFTAFGAYVEQEKTKKDDWTKKSILDIWKHLSSEMDEISPHMKTIHELIHTNQKEPTEDSASKLIWNCCDLVGLSLMLLEKIMTKAGMMEEK